MEILYKLNFTTLEELKKEEATLSQYIAAKTKIMKYLKEKEDNKFDKIIRAMKVNNLEISVRLRTAFKSIADYDFKKPITDLTINDVLKTYRNPSEFLKIPNVGYKTLREFIGLLFDSSHPYEWNSYKFTEEDWNRIRYDDENIDKFIDELEEDGFTDFDENE